MGLSASASSLHSTPRLLGVARSSPEKWVIRIPFPGRVPWIDEKVDSEVVTMKYSLPVPIPLMFFPNRLLGFQASHRSPVVDMSAKKQQFQSQK